MDIDIITAVALGIGLAASAGFRIFVPMLVASIAAHFGVFPLQEGFAWLAGWPAMICFGTATVIEILTYYIPFVDNLLDSITTPLAVGAGTLLLTSVLPIDNNMLKWLTGFIVGGGLAATVQSGTVITRLASTATTGGTANPIVATGEHAAAVGTSVLSLVIPLVVASVLIILVIVMLIIFRKKILRKRNVLRQKLTNSPDSRENSNGLGKKDGVNVFALCSICHHKLDSTMLFCPNCGARIHKINLNN
jgi:hypothetical protein